jgi:hypothetical protein
MQITFRQCFLQFKIIGLHICYLKTKTVMYKNVICASVLYWCETWSLILREGECPRVFDKRQGSGFT